MTRLETKAAEVCGAEIADVDIGALENDPYCGLMDADPDCDWHDDDISFELNGRGIGPSEATIEACRAGYRRAFIDAQNEAAG